MTSCFDMTDLGNIALNPRIVVRKGSVPNH
jgi:hypothetical protein